MQVIDCKDPRSSVLALPTWILLCISGVLLLSTGIYLFWLSRNRKNGTPGNDSKSTLENIRCLWILDWVLTIVGALVVITGQIIIFFSYCCHYPFRRNNFEIRRGPCCSHDAMEDCQENPDDSGSADKGCGDSESCVDDSWTK